MKSSWYVLLASATLAGALALPAAAQEASGTINTLTVNPRQNQELTNSTGTESGQPSDAVPGSQSQENGLVPVTSNMEGSGSNGNMTQTTPGSKPARPSAAAEAKPKSSATQSQQKAQPSPKPTK